jgi:alpha/beta superfamily hydrolase
MPTETRLLAGEAGAIEVMIDRPEGASRGVALVAHPHPLFGGTADNKVVQTLSRALVLLGYTALRPNFRGVGQSEGQFDTGNGETVDLLAVLEAFFDDAKGEVVLAGFSFGAFVQTRVADALQQRGTPAKAIVLVGLAVTNFTPSVVPENTLLIHGEEDDTVPLSAVLDWARPHDLAVTVVPGADHFFHRRLMIIKRLVLASFTGRLQPQALGQHASEQ